MTAYIIRRLLFMIPTIFGIMLVSFVVVQFAPGGPIERVIAQLSGTDTGATSRISGSPGGDFGARGATPGSAVNPGPLYRLPTFSLFPFILSGISLGLAQGAVDEFTGSMRVRAGTYVGKKLAELATVQLRLAEASALTDAAEKVMIADCDEATRQTEAGDIATQIERLVNLHRNTFGAL